MEIHTKVVPGHPEFWDVAHELCPKFFAAAKQLEPHLNEIFSVGPSEPLHNDAMKVARSMFEGAVTVAYLKKHPSELKDYMDFVWISNRKLMNFLKAYDPEKLEEISPEATSRSDREFRRVKPRFTTSRGQIRPHWCKHPFSQMVADVGLTSWYPSFYHLASAMHHVDMRGLVAQLERNPDPEVLDADIAPSEEWLDQALLAAHVSVVFSLEQYVDMTSPEKKGVIDSALKTLQEAWTPNARPTSPELRERLHAREAVAVEPDTARLVRDERDSR